MGVYIGRWTILAILLPAMFLTIGSNEMPVARASLAWGRAITVNSYANFNGLGQAGEYPADPQVAVGTNHILEMVNSRVAVYNKQTLALISSQDLWSFFGATSTAFEGDPRALYDSSSGKWFASDLEGRGCSGSVENCTTYYINYAASATSDPTGNWYVNRIQTPWLPDHPQMAVTDDKIVITVNAEDTPYWVINKAQVLSGSSAPDTYSNTIPEGLGWVDHQLTPVLMQSSGTTAYMVSIDTTYRNRLYIFTITGTPGIGSGVTNTNQSVVVTPFNPYPYTPEQPSGTDFGAYNWGSRAAIAFQGKLWFASPDGCVPTGDVTYRTCIRLIQLSLPSLNKTQDFDYSMTGAYVFYPGISFDGMGDLDMIYSYSSSTIAPSLAIAGQAVGDSGMMSSNNLIQTQTVSDPTNRSGDYFGAAVDPSNPSFVWVVGSYYSTSSPTVWSTLISKMRVEGLQLSASSFAENVGIPASTRVTVQALAGFSGFVSFRALSSLSQDSSVAVSPTNLTLASGGSGVTTVTVTVANSDCPQPNCSFSLDVTANAQALNLWSTIEIPVTTVYFDFAASLSPTSLTITPSVDSDTSVNSILTLTLFANATVSNSTSFSVSGQPAYMQVTFSPTAALPSSSGTPITVTFKIPAGGKFYTTQSYSIIVTALGFGKTHTSTLRITVHANCSPRGYCWI